MLFVLAKCGWAVNITKHEEISQKKVFLGLLVNSISMEFEIPQPKLDNFLVSLRQVKSQAIPPMRLLARFLGKLNLFSRALGQVVRLMTRSLYACLEPAYSTGWESVTSLTVLAREELEFWESNRVKLNVFAIPIATPITPSITSCELIAGDASGVGLYTANFLEENKTVYSRKLTATEMKESSTHRECLTILGIYTNPSSPIYSFRRRQILHLTDNKGVVSVFTIGLSNKHLKSMAVKVY